MTATKTEDLHETAAGLDQRPLDEIAMILASAQTQATRAVQHAMPEICAGATAMADTIRSDGHLHYAAAGSSGLMAAADAQELGGTFSIPRTQLRIHMAGGLPISVDMPGATEDDTGVLETDLAGLTHEDTLIAVSASGTTPYTLKAAQIAKARNATVIGIANNKDAALLDLADHAILLETPPEVLSGSTRMGAGTAQKIALNMLSTLMAVRLGHVHDGMMVNLHADNTKLRARAQGIVQHIAQKPQETARAALEAAQGDVKSAILIASHGITPKAASDMLVDTQGHLRPALDRLT